MTDPAKLAHDKAHGFEIWRCNDHAKTMEELKKDLHGNGKDGLADNVIDLKIKMARVETKLTITIALLLPLLMSTVITAIHLLTGK